MERTITRLKGEIVELMKRKFGREVDIDELEEVQLKRMVFDLRMSLLDVRSLYERELDLWSRKYAEKQAELAKAINDNTARLELLALINREKTELARIIDHQNKKREHLDNVVDVADVYKDDIKKLTEIVKNQNKELQLLRDEIRRLGMKGVPPTKERSALEKLKPEEEEMEDDLFQWQGWGYDMPTERAPQPVAEAYQETKYPPVTTEVQIPPVYVFKNQANCKTIINFVVFRFPDEAEEVAKSLIVEMLESMEPFQDMSKPVMENLVEQIVPDILGRASVVEIIENLLSLLPYDPTDQQQSIIEVTAEQIFSLQEPQVIII